MASGSDARAAIQSFASERRLAERGDREALYYKYLARMGRGDRREVLLSGFDWLPPKYADDLSPEEDKQFYGIRVEYSTDPPASAIDRETGCRLKRRPRRGNILLHLQPFGGKDELLGRLALAARYLRANDDAHEAPIVAGVTYERMGRLVAAMGMRRMEITRIEPEYSQDIEAYHRAHYAVSLLGEPPHFSPAAVYLPTDEFINRYDLSDRAQES